MASLARSTLRTLTASLPSASRALPLPRFALPISHTLHLPSSSSSPSLYTPIQTRGYAKKSKGARRSNDDDDVEPVSKGKGKASKKGGTGGSSSGGGKKGSGAEEAEDVEAIEAWDQGLVDKAKDKMGKSVDWCKTVGFDGVERGKGRANPALLDSVKVDLGTGKPEPLQAVASVTVRNSGLIVEVYDSDSMKKVLSALNKANLPGISPNKQDERTILIPITRPTQEQRAAILKHITDSAEQAKQQIRTARTDGLKGLKDKDGKNGWAGKEMQDLTDKNCAAIDELVAKAKKELAKA